MRKVDDPARRTQGVLGGRSEQVVRRVLAAALSELARSGYSEFRMSEVASKARVNKTTIYRRWPSRRALVTAVVERMKKHFMDNPLPDTGRVERDLVNAFAMRTSASRKSEGRAWAKLLVERYNPEVQKIIRKSVDERSTAWRDMVTRAIRRGELPRGTDPKLVLHVIRTLVDAERPDAAWLALAVRTAIAGAKAGTLKRRYSPQPATARPRRAP